MHKKVSKFTADVITETLTGFYSHGPLELLLRLTVLAAFTVWLAWPLSVFMGSMSPLQVSAWTFLPVVLVFSVWTRKGPTSA